MILADTSVWVEHLRRGDAALAGLLAGGEVLMHRFILGELACGNLRNRADILGHMSRLPQATHATDAEVLEFIERRRLIGRGLGYVDVHLLAATALSASTKLLTRDRRLAAVARELRLAAG